MADYVAKQGTTALGIIGTSLGGIATVAPLIADALGGANRNANTGVADMAAGAALAAALGNRNNNASSDDRPVSRYELSIVQENAILKAQADVDKKLVDVYANINTQIGDVKERFNSFEKEQLVYNGVNNAAVSVLQSQVAALMGLTKTVIPNGNVCPGWGDVKVNIVTNSTDADRSLSQAFEKLAGQELDHAEILHAQATRLIKDKKENGTEPPASMLAVWEWEHENMIECVAKMKLLLSEL